MRCSDVRKQLEAGSGLSVLVADTALREHLADCAECRALAEDLRVQRLLRTLPAPQPPQGFADRALRQAWRQGAGQRSGRALTGGWTGLAAAASILVAVLVVLTAAPWRAADEAVSPDMRVVQIPADGVGKVRVVLNSPRALPNATITVNLDEGLNLAGYPDTRTLRWQTPIRMGKNMLELPVMMQQRQRGNLTIDIESGESRKQMQLSVEAREQKPEARLLI